jgi:hypothetical protein
VKYYSFSPILRNEGPLAPIFRLCGFDRVGAEPRPRNITQHMEDPFEHLVRHAPDVDLGYHAGMI